MFITCVRTGRSEETVRINARNVVVASQSAVGDVMLYLDKEAENILATPYLVVKNRRLKTVAVSGLSDIEPALSAIVDRLDTLAEVVESLKK